MPTAFIEFIYITFKIKKQFYGPLPRAWVCGFGWVGVWVGGGGEGEDDKRIDGELAHTHDYPQHHATTMGIDPIRSDPIIQ